MDTPDMPTPINRADLVRSLAEGLRFGRTRIHHGDDLMARLAAEKLADFLADANLAVVQAPSSPEADGQQSLFTSERTGKAGPC